MKKIFSPKEIPGMIEPIEQILLENLSKSIDFESGESIVEFGTFFGRSTACIASGLKANPTFNEKSKFYAFDSFECNLSGSFYPHVLSNAKAGNVEFLLTENNNKIGFLPIFENYLNSYISDGILIPMQAELKNSFSKHESIKLMHIDSPKFYSEFKYILFRFFPYLKRGGFVIFQDFFYHWSASLIAVCGLMLKKGLLHFEKSAASSLLCKVNCAFSADLIQEIDLEMSDNRIVPVLIDFLIDEFKDFDLDRREIFLPRLTLAKIQWFFENNYFSASASEVVKFFNQGNQLNKPLANDFIELMNYGFSIRRLYEIDHS
jgi:Methyltransferase domain